MARINIDEKWKTDPRRTALAQRIGSRQADGMLVEITWVLLGYRGGLIPLKEFKFIENYNDWLECGLASVEDGMVRISGASIYEEYFKKQALNGKRGGRPRKPNETQKNPTKPKHNPEKPSSSSSSSIKEKYIKKEKFESLEELLAAVPQKTKEVWHKLYPADFLSRESLRAFEYYSHRQPKNLRGWSRALGGWLERGWKWAEQEKAKRGSEFGGWEHIDGV